jgi:hypothetical protein
MSDRRGAAPPVLSLLSAMCEGGLQPELAFIAFVGGLFGDVEFAQQSLESQLGAELGKDSLTAQNNDCWRIRSSLRRRRARALLHNPHHGKSLA